MSHPTSRARAPIAAYSSAMFFPLSCVQRDGLPCPLYCTKPLVVIPGHGPQTKGGINRVDAEPRPEFRLGVFRVLVADMAFVAERNDEFIVRFPRHCIILVVFCHAHSYVRGFIRAWRAA